MTKRDPRDFEERYRTCFFDFGVKAVAGMVIGSMIGAFFFPSKGKWPMLIGGGLGLGIGYGNCESSLNEYLINLDPKLCKVKKEP